MSEEIQVTVINKKIRKEIKFPVNISTYDFIKKLQEGFNEIESEHFIVKVPNKNLLLHKDDNLKEFKITNGDIL